MLLRDISLYLNLEEYDRLFNSEFQFRTRCLCNFLRRRIISERIRSEGFGSIAIEGTEHRVPECAIEGDRVLVARIPFEEAEYKSATTIEMQEIFISMIEKGIEICRRSHDVPAKLISRGIDDFRDGGYRNEWVVKTRSYRHLGLRAVLTGRLSVTQFELRLRLERGSREVLNTTVLDTLPDETVFSHRFKDLSLDGTSLSVKDKRGRPVYSVDIGTLRDA